LIAGTFLLVSACSNSTTPPIEPIQIRTSPVERPELVLPTVDPIVTRPVNWTVITSENYEEVFERLRAQNVDLVLIGLTATGYENLSLNLNDLRTFIEQQNAVIIAYRNYYIRSQQALSQAVVIR
jgi:hypothetical protein